MTPTLEDLRAALQESAEQVQCPDPSTTLAAVEHGAAARDRRRRSGRAALAAAAIAIGSGLLAWEHGRDDSSPARPATMIADDPRFPAFVRGLMRLTVVDLPLARGARAVVTTRVRSQNLLYLAAACDGGEPMLSVTSGKQQKYLKCPSTGTTDPALGLPVLWRPADAGDQLVVRPARSALGSGHAVVAVYQEVGWDEYRFPPRPHNLEAGEGTTWGSQPGALFYGGPTDPARPNASRTVRVPYAEGLAVRLHARAPGLLRVAVNGHFLPLQCASQTSQAVCGSPDNTMVQWAYGPAEAGNRVDQAVTGLRPGQRVEVTVYPDNFAGDDWRLEVTTAWG